MRQQISRTLRYQIFERDNFRCRRCGRGADDGVKLQIDHIVAVVDGGSKESTNLWTLCLDCNYGKRGKSDFGVEVPPVAENRAPRRTDHEQKT
jgi:5-methylcytosine-specific restriction endonuclease McrA